MFTHLIRLACPVAFVFMLACADSPTGTPDLSPRVIPFYITTPRQLALPIPRMLQITWLGGREEEVITWASLDSSIASVSDSGLVTARLPGTTTIRARRGNTVAELQVGTVATSIDILPGTPNLKLDSVLMMVAIVRDADGAAINGVPVSWTSGNSSVAQIQPTTGALRAIARGATTVEAIGGGARGYATVSVEMTASQFAFSTIGSTSNHLCALGADTGIAYCWGDNHSGALGTGDMEGSLLPTLVSGDRRYTSLSVGDYATCAIERATALAWCWGWNRHGDLGDGSTATRWEPARVAGSIRFSSVSASGTHTCGVEVESGSGYCWGQGGLIGNGTQASHSTPVRIGAGESLRFSSISSGPTHSCGLEAESGHAFCWGLNGSGQLGSGNHTDQPAPLAIVARSQRFTSIATGASLTCAIEAATEIAYCWGLNQSGQIGDGTTSDRPVPTPVANGRLRFVNISASLNGDVCAVEAQTARAYCWGRGISSTGPALVGDGSMRFSSVVAAYGVGCGVEAATGIGYCWPYSRMTPATILPAS